MTRRAFIKRNGLWLTGALAFPTIVRAQVMPSARHIAAPKPAANADTLPNGLIGWWKLDEGTGTTMADSSSSAATATPNSQIQWNTTTGKFGNCVNLLGGAYGIQVATHTAFDSLTDLSISCWLKTTTASRMALVTKVTTPSNFQWWMRINSTGTIQFITATSAGAVYQTATSTGSAAGGNWHNAIVTLAGTTMQLYLDGSPDGTGGSTSGSRNTNDASAAMNFGLGASETRFNGSLDDIRIWNRALTSGEVTQLQSQA